MALINLRPWREELRARRQRHFLLALAVAVLSAVLVSAIVGMLLEARISEQQRRNTFLQQQIGVINSEIREVRELRERREQLLARMQVIQALQDDRSVIVRLFDELARTLVDGIYFERLERQDRLLVIEGRARHNQQISQWMRLLARSELFEAPTLTAVNADPQGRAKESRFTLRIRERKAQEKP